MFLQRLLQFVGWPITAGVIIALLTLLLFPQLRGAPPIPSTSSNNLGTGVVSYADAVNRAAPAVVNVYTEKRVVQRNQNLSNNPFFVTSTTIPIPHNKNVCKRRSALE